MPPTAAIVRNFLTIVANVVVLEWSNRRAHLILLTRRRLIYTMVLALLNHVLRRNRTAFLLTILPTLLRFCCLARGIPVITIIIADCTRPTCTTTAVSLSGFLSVGRATAMGYGI